ncbi:MAG TPA: cytochrome c-type biogenesis protein CcmH [Gemmatimonadaceae bacterium]|nr:cytochrome c-type biogenesis protein CcmH [Gemmatimonadaceae bacterium]
MTISRRAFFVQALTGSAALVGGAGYLGAQQQAVHDSSLIQTDTGNLFAMNQMAAKSVTLPPKPGAAPSMTADERDALEHKIRCQCGCTLDVYTCRTTDFSCQVSPAMHRDVMALVEGGHSAQEIIDAFVGAYGERALMAPTKSGFNLVAWFTPGIALVLGGIGVAFLLRRWRERPAPAATAPSVGMPTDATADELAQLEAAVRGEDDR